MIIVSILLVIAGVAAAEDFITTLRDRGRGDYSSRVHRVIGLVITGTSALLCFGVLAWGAFGGVA